MRSTASCRRTRTPTSRTPSRSPARSRTLGGRSGPTEEPHRNALTVGREWHHLQLREGVPSVAKASPALFIVCWNSCNCKKNCLQASRDGVTSARAEWWASLTYGGWPEPWLRPLLPGRGAKPQFLAGVGSASHEVPASRHRAGRGRPSLLPRMGTFAHSFLGSSPGAGCGSRTRTPLRTTVFETVASTIPPTRLRTPTAEHFQRSRAGKPARRRPSLSSVHVRDNLLM
jgi:hypothetical protein